MAAKKTKSAIRVDAIQFSDEPFIPNKDLSINEIKHNISTGADGANIFQASEKILSQMSNEDLFAKLIQIEQQSAIVYWKIWWILRKRYNSDTEFGRYIKEIENTDFGQTLCLTNQKKIYRSWRAGKFCETYKIDDLADFKLSKTVVYELSAAINEDVAGKVLESIKNKDIVVRVQEVKLLLEQSKAVATIYPLSNEVEAVVEVETEVVAEVEENGDEGLKAIKKVIAVVELYQDVISIDALILELQKLTWR